MNTGLYGVSNQNLAKTKVNIFIEKIADTNHNGSDEIKTLNVFSNSKTLEGLHNQRDMRFEEIELFVIDSSSRLFMEGRFEERFELIPGEISLGRSSGSLNDLIQVYPVLLFLAIRLFSGARVLGGA